MSEPCTQRRGFLTGLLAAGLIPARVWADAGSPAYLSAAAHKGGEHVLCGIDAGLNVVFQIPLPARGHAAAAHPSRPEAVAFARRPGTYAIVLDCVSGLEKAKLSAPEGRHFYGHGTYSASGDWLFTTENDFELGRGCIGVWDVRAGYVRKGEFASGGIGPHDIQCLPGSETLVVANGGIDTHPDTGRTKLNIPTMRPNLAYLEDGELVEVAELPPEMHKNSIRHMAVGPGGAVAFGMQWQGDGAAPALVGWHRRGTPIRLMQASADHRNALNGYIGSIAWSPDGKTIAASSPRGGRVHFYEVQSESLSMVAEMEDVCGLAAAGAGFMATSGRGELKVIAMDHDETRRMDDLMWDNHLVRL